MKIGTTNVTFEDRRLTLFNFAHFFFNGPDLSTELYGTPKTNNYDTDAYHPPPATPAIVDRIPLRSGDRRDDRRY